MGIALQIIDIATASIPEDMQPVRVEKINIKVGKLSAIVNDSLNFCFEIASKDTPLDGAQLVIEEIPIIARCITCEKEWTIDSPVFSCPLCEGGDIKLLSGRELDIESIELADGE